MEVAGELVHQGCPLPRAAREQRCPAPMRHHVHINLHAQMAFELKKNPFPSIFHVPANGWLALVPGVREGLPTEPEGGWPPVCVLGCEPFLAALRACGCHAQSCIGLILFRNQAGASML